MVRSAVVGLTERGLSLEELLQSIRNTATLLRKNPDYGVPLASFENFKLTMRIYVGLEWNHGIYTAYPPADIGTDYETIKERYEKNQPKALHPSRQKFPEPLEIERRTVEEAKEMLGIAGQIRSRETPYKLKPLLDYLHTFKMVCLLNSPDGDVYRKIKSAKEVYRAYRTIEGFLQKSKSAPSNP
ncbi:hypothetical protein HYX00_01415 [Candidatus Woesearchaeota archaeon]|nr:hypothetical protein [Candidatus Woesearchaeota archaeon]